MSGSHSATKDAIASMKLYKLYNNATDNERKSMVNKIHSGRIPVSIAKQRNYIIDGVCLSAFNSRFCTCDDNIL